MAEQQHKTATPTTNDTHGPTSDNPLAKRFATSRRWVLWKREPGKDGKPTKVCYQVDGRKAASTRPTEWSTLAQVEAKRADYDGIGLMFADDRQLIGIDLDHVVENGAITDPASRDLVETAQTHTELSPSGTGLHLWLLTPEPIDLVKHKQGAYEVYNRARYLTVTGAIFGEARDVRTVTPAEMSQLLAIVGYPWTQPGRQAEARSASSAQPVTLDDHALIEKARSSKHGAEFGALWSGNCDAKKADGTPDWSVADMRLVCRLIWWTGRDAARTERLWLQSGLGKRDKVAERADYRAGTIEKALALIPGGYDGTSRRTPTAPDVPDFDDIGNQDDAVEDQDVGQDPVAAGRDQAEVDAYLNTRPMTDTGNAESMARLYGDQLRFIDELKSWRAWNGAYWRTAGAESSALQAARDTARKRQSAAWPLADNEQRAARIKHGLSSENAARIGATVQLARITEPFYATLADFDQHRNLLATPTATIDLETGKAYEPKRADHMTRIAGAAYVQGATCARWDQFMREIFTDPATNTVDDELIAYVYRCMGYSLTGETREQCFWLLHGHGSNGKSVFLDILAQLVGAADDGYHAVATFSLLDADVSEREASLKLSELRGKRVLTIIESAEDRRLDEARIKSLTGEDLITCRNHYSGFITYRPQFKAWLAMNHRPTIAGRDYAMWRRPKPIPFLQTFKDKNADKTLRERLRSEQSGILNRVIAGARDWYEHGLDEPASVTRAIEDYKQDSDILGRWLDERTIEKHGARMHYAAAYADFKNWMKDRGHEPPSATTWANRLDEHPRGNVTKTKESGQTVFYGRGLRTVDQS